MRIRKVAIFGKSILGMLDNSKYLMNYLCNQNCEFDFFFVAEEKNVYKTLKRHRIPVVFRDLKRHEIVIKESDIWIMCDWLVKDWYAHLLSKRNKTFQMWHGIPLKDVSIKIKKQKIFPESYEVFISTSEFVTENAFKKIFKSTTFLISGYPRNDIFFKEEYDERDLINVDVDTLNLVLKKKNEGFKIGVLMPTLTYTGHDFILSGSLPLDELSKFGKKQDVIFILKLHPTMDLLGYKINSQSENIIVYDGKKDIYPLLKFTDFLITDYSSVYFDYLLLDKPIIFYTPDFEKMESMLLFSSKFFFPGHIAKNQKELLKVLKSLVKEKDSFGEQRKILRKMMFRHIDGKASDRIYRYIKNSL